MPYLYGTDIYPNCIVHTMKLSNIDRISDKQSENYLDSLSKNQRTFLTTDNLRGMDNQKDTRNKLMHKLKTSMRNVHELMKITKNLKEDELYRIFNAPNLELFFLNLLKDSRYNSIKNNQQLKKKYDIRTSEVARVMVEVGLNYLTQSDKFKDNEKTLENVDNIINDFRFLSSTLFSEETKESKKQETREIFSSPLWNKIEKKIKMIEEKSPIPIDEFMDIEELKKTLVDDRPEILNELVAVQNKIEFNKNNHSEKKKLLKVQSNYRKNLDETDRTLELINDKEILEYVKLALFINPHQNLELYLSSLKPITAKKMIEDSKEYIKIIA